MSESCAWIVSKRRWIALPNHLTEMDTNGSGTSATSVSHGSIVSIIDDGDDEREDRRGRVHDRGADHHAHGVEIVRGARHQVARAIGLVERERKAFEVREEIVAQVVFDIARDADDDSAHQEAEDAANDGETEQEQGVVRQLAAGHPRGKIIDGVLQHPRRELLEAGGSGDAQKANREGAAVAGEVGPQSAPGPRARRSEGHECPV